jgi:hypothetical protein
MNIDPAAGPERAYPRSRAIWVPGVLALGVAGLLWLIDGVAVMMASWDTRQPGLHWLGAGASGQRVLAIAAGIVLCVGVTYPRWRRGAAVTAWGIIALEVGWFVLTDVLSRP